MDTGLRLVLEALNSHELARKLGISRQAIEQWKRIPAGRIVDIERVTGISRERLRPELYKR